MNNFPLEDYDKIRIEVSASQYLVLGKAITEEEENLVITSVLEEEILSRMIFRLLPLERFGRIK